MTDSRSATAMLGVSFAAMTRFYQAPGTDPVSRHALATAIGALDLISGVALRDAVLGQLKHLIALDAPELWRAIADRLGADLDAALLFELADVLVEGGHRIRSSAPLHSMLEIWNAGCHPRMRIVLKVWALDRSDRDLLEAVCAAGPAEVPVGTDSSTMAALEKADDATAAIFLVHLSPDVLADLLETAMIYTRPAGFERLLRVVAQRAQLPQVGDDPQRRPFRDKIVAISSAHAFLRWRIASEAWLATALAAPQDCPLRTVPADA